VPHQRTQDEHKAVLAATAAVRLQTACEISDLKAECSVLKQQLEQLQAASMAAAPVESQDADRAAAAKQQLESELSATQQQLRDEQEKCTKLEQQLTEAKQAAEANKRRADQSTEELADADADANADKDPENECVSPKRVRTDLAQHRPLLADAFFHRVWLRDAVPLGESEQGGLAEVGVGEEELVQSSIPKQMRNPGLARFYTPEFGRGKALEKANVYLQMPVVRLYKMTYAYRGELRHASSELRAMQMLSALDSPYFPRMLGEAGIITARKDKKDGDSDMSDHEVQQPAANKRRRVSDEEDKHLRRLNVGIAMEYIPSITISRLLRNYMQWKFPTLLSPLGRLQLCTQLVRGMELMAKQRIIHRDIKPGNILVAAPEILRQYIDKPKIEDPHKWRQMGSRKAPELPAMITQMRTKRWVPPPTSRAGGNITSQAAARSVGRLAEEAAVLRVDAYCTDTYKDFKQEAPQDSDVAGARLVIIDFNLADFAEHPAYSYKNSTWGTHMYRWHHWFEWCNFYRKMKCCSAKELALQHDQFAVGLVMLDMLRGVSVERLSIERIGSAAALWLQEFTAWVDSVCSGPRAAVGFKETCSQPSVARFFMDPNATLSSEAWDQHGNGFVAANLEMRKTLTRHRELYDMLHNMTRMRISDGVLSNIKPAWGEIPSMSQVNRVLTAALTAADHNKARKVESSH
jgi:serine/threonine protein kinase